MGDKSQHIRRIRTQPTKIQPLRPQRTCRLTQKRCSFHGHHIPPNQPLLPIRPNLSRITHAPHFHGLPFWKYVRIGRRGVAGRVEDRYEDAKRDARSGNYRDGYSFRDDGVVLLEGEESEENKREFAGVLGEAFAESG